MDTFLAWHLGGINWSNDPRKKWNNDHQPLAGQSPL